MKSWFIKFFLILDILLISCTNEEPVPKTILEENSQPLPEEQQAEVYFTFETHLTAEQTIETDDAIMLHDFEGNLLDFKTYEGGDILEFESKSMIEPDNFTVSILRRASYSGERPLDTNTITTYSNIQNKSNWKIKYSAETPNRPQGNLIGGFNLSVTDLPEELLRFRLSNYDAGRSQGEYTYLNGLYTLNLINLGLYEQNDFILSIVEKNGTKKYLKINDVQPDDNLVINYEEFLEYDHTIEIQLPSNFINQYYLQRVAQEQNESLTNGMFYLDSFDAGRSSNPPNKFTLGFINDLPTYETVISIFAEDYRYYYRKLGTRTNQIVLKKPSFTIQNTSIFDFQFTTDTKYIYRISEWRTDPNSNFETIWEIVTSYDENPKINEFPDNLKEIFPTVEIANLLRSNTVFYLRSITYPEFIKGRFVKDAPPLDYIGESESYMVWD